MPSVALYPAAALISGALLGLVEAPLFPSWLPAASCLAAVIAYRFRLTAGVVACVLAGCACSGAILGAHARMGAVEPMLRLVLDREVGGFAIETQGPEQDHDPIPMRGRVLEDASPRDGFVSVRLRVLALRPAADWQPAEGTVSVSVGGDAAAALAGEWLAGRVIEAPATFRRPDRYINDGVPDFERDVALRGTSLFASVKSGLVVQIVQPGSAFEEWAAAVRMRVRAAIARWVTPHDPVAGGIVTAVLIGDRTGLPDEIRNRLQAAGTYHVIAISGGNIAILTGLVDVVLMTLGLRRRAVAAVALPMLLLYAQIAVAGPSVWRATLMAVLYLAARVIDHRTGVWQATALAAALMVIGHPLDLRDAGFVLTFGATIALVEGARRGLGAGQGGLRSWLLASVAASLAVETALLPIAAQVFSRITSAGLVLNLAAVPLMAIAQVAGMVVVATDALPGVAAIAGWLAATGARGIVESARLVDIAPWLTSPVPPPGLVAVLVYYSTLALALWSRHRLVRRAATVAFICAAAFIVLALPNPLAHRLAPSPLRLTMFDVGQGEALLVESGVKRMLIDTGGPPFGAGAFDIGSRVLAPALWHRGIRSLDALLVTHGDPDHAGGAASIVETFSPERFWEGIAVPGHEPSDSLRQHARDDGADLAFRRAPETFAWGEAVVRVLHPPEPDWERRRVRNDDSVVLDVRYGDVAVLLTGDISADVERAILPELAPARVRILKVAHHGSRTSTSAALLDAWRPQIALISAGRGNSFGHPAPDVVARLEAAGARVFRTDRHGQITVDVNGQGVRVHTSVGESYR